MKYADYDIQLEEALDVQPLPHVDAEPYGLGIFKPATNLEESKARRANMAEGGIESQGPTWDAVMDTPALPAPGISRAHNYYASMVKAILFSLSGALATCMPTTLASPGPSSNPTPSQGPNVTLTQLAEQGSSQSAGSSKDLLEEEAMGENQEAEEEEATPHKEAQAQETLLVEGFWDPMVPLVLRVPLAHWDHLDRQDFKEP
ncbi:hypothetical protein BS47DRAFT_1393716 [Hydnum rufescens UP504]|uniref:Uncharacterized protein n=1 Tax=Hydnum rufescens UP504 TaxID=1448309 RepID=A0A9P6AW25_9AGAM|nr:hypothetical protein BS47DRAFT_1393716 [Hydnum rufescens UP504]